MRWFLRFRSEAGVAVDAVAAVLAEELSAPTVTQGAWDGNPHDGYHRAWTLRARGGALETVLTFHEHAQRESSDTPPDTTSLSVALGSERADAARMLARWRQLAAAFARLGYEDESYTEDPRQVAIDLEAAGMGAEAAALRAEVTRALVRAVPSHASVSLARVCPDDVEAVLAAYTRPLDKSTLSLGHSGLRALPAGLARFRNAEHLYLNEPAFDAAALEGWSFPKLHLLALSESGTVHIPSAALRGFPALAQLYVAHTPLESIDLDLRKVCPKLRLLHVGGTPLARDPSKLQALRAAFKGGRIET